MLIDQPTTTHQVDLVGALKKAVGGPEVGRVHTLRSLKKAPAPKLSLLTVK